MKKRKTNAFTLVELLAVIAILAIILLIAVPMILGVIEDARKDSFRNSVRGVFHAIELKHAQDGVTSGTVEELDLSGERLTGTWEIVNNEIILTNVCSDNYCVSSLEDTNKGTEFAVTDSEGNVSGGEDKPPVVEQPKEKLIDKLVASINEQNEELNASNAAYNLQTCVKVSDTEYTGDCYFKGGNPNNAIWASGRLWKVMGINTDGTIKMVTAKPQISIAHHATSQAWADSYVNQWINDVFYNGLNSNLQNLIVAKEWDITAYDGNGVRQTESSSTASKVGLISYQEYLKASSNYIDGTNGTCTTGISQTTCGKESDGTIVNYLFDNLRSWTLTPSSSDASYVWYVFYTGSLGSSTAAFPIGVAPAINIESSITVSGGNGNLSSPYIIEEEKEVTTLASADIGSYVNFGGYTWRIVSHEAQGTKLIMNDCLRDESGTVITQAFDADNTQVFNLLDSEGDNIGYYLNTTWTGLNAVKDRLVDATWNLGKYGPGDGYNYDYNTTTTDKTYADVTAKIGLIRAGEQFASQFMDTKTNYWTLTPRSSGASYVANVSSNGILGGYYATVTYGVSPAIVLSSSTSISSGNGNLISGSAYVIE